MTSFPRNGKKQSGFTLLELLVVVLIMGLMVSITIFSIGDQQQDELDSTMLRLQQSMRLAHEEAVLNGIEYAIKFSRHAYEYQSLEEVDEKIKWVTVNQPRFMLPRELDDFYEFKLYQDGIPVPLDEEDSGRVLLASSGEMTPFELTLRIPDADLSLEMTGTPFGVLSVKEWQQAQDEEEF